MHAHAVTDQRYDDWTTYSYLYFYADGRTSGHHPLDQFTPEEAWADAHRIGQDAEYGPCLEVRERITTIRLIKEPKNAR